MIEWLSESLYLVFRIFVILLIIAAVTGFLAAVKDFIDNYELRRNQREWKNQEWPNNNDEEGS